MCRAADIDISVYTETLVKKSRKDHVCGECGRTIERGESYLRAFSICDGDPFTNLFCTHCIIPMKWLIENCSTYIYTEVRSDIREHARDYKRTDLARMSVAMKRGWRRFDGKGLMQPMLLPPPIKVAA